MVELRGDPTKRPCGVYHGDPDGPPPSHGTISPGRSMSAFRSAAETLPAQFNVATWFVDRNVAQGRGAAPAFHCEGRTLTYADVLERVNRTGNALRQLGLGAGDRVLLLCLDGPEFVGSFWGAIKVGAVAVPVN